MTDEVQTFPFTVANREITLRVPLLGQLIMLQRHAQRARDKMETETDPQIRNELTTSLIVRSLEVVESLVVNPEDLEFLEEALLQGKVDYSDLTDALRAAGEQRNDEKEKPTPKARARKVATTVASNARTKR